MLIILRVSIVLHFEKLLCSGDRNLRYVKLPSKMLNIDGVYINSTHCNKVALSSISPEINI